MYATYIDVGLKIGVSELPLKGSYLAQILLSVGATETAIFSDVVKGDVPMEAAVNLVEVFAETLMTGIA